MSRKFVGAPFKFNALSKIRIVYSSLDQPVLEEL